jgi:hypothetical protein
MPTHPEPDPRPEPFRPRPTPASGGRAREAAPADPLLVFETAGGRVRRCDCCDTLRVHFGAALLAVDTAGFATLLDTVAAFDRGDTPLGPWPEGHALIHVGETGAAFAFTPAEIADLHRLLSGARLLVELRLPEPPAA